MNTALMNDIKFNCDVSDAKYWGYFSICGLLMRYRDLYRSEKGLKAWSEIDRKEIGAWIADKESRWPALEGEDLRELSFKGRKFHPFDVDGVNQALKERGLIYGAGYGMYMKPTFFLAELRSRREFPGLTVYMSGTEYVRDLFTSPGMLQDKTIFIRLEPLAMLLLYKYSELNTRNISALEDAFNRYGFPHRQLINSEFEKRLHRVVEGYAEVLLCHELAEAREAVPEWKDLLARAGDRKLEHFLRAVKDLVADTSDHGPFRRIIDTRDRGALGLTIALMEGYRRALYPEIKNAYIAFSEHEDWSLIEQARREGYGRFRTLRDRIVALHRDSEGGEEFIRKLREVLQKAGV